MPNPVVSTKNVIGILESERSMSDDAAELGAGDILQLQNWILEQGTAHMCAEEIH